ncbi:MAG: protease modulator HflC [Candidatus Omnitrophica bacterium]|nr:protease modulator HflC [Candidatus Omnitrophota bacterium]
MNMNLKRPMLVLLLVVLLGAVLLPQTLFVINEWEQAIITQFGQFRRTVSEPGLKMKIPFLETIQRFDKRILASDAVPGEYLTKDKKRLLADHVTRWRIEDPLLYFKTVRDEFGALARLDDIVYSEMRRTLAENDFADVIATKREKLMETIAENARDLSKQFGINVMDVRIKRADLPSEVQASVFARMVAERERIAKRYRSEGDEEAAKIRGETDKNKTIILAEAYEQSQKTKGEGDREAAKIYAEAYGIDPEFYRFVKSLETYEQAMKEGASYLLSSDSELLKYFKSTSGQTQSA